MADKMCLTLSDKIEQAIACFADGPTGYLWTYYKRAWRDCKEAWLAHCKGKHLWMFEEVSVRSTLSLLDALVEERPMLEDRPVRCPCGGVLRPLGTSGAIVRYRCVACEAVLVEEWETDPNDGVFFDGDMLGWHWAKLPLPLRPADQRLRAVGATLLPGFEEV